MPQPRQLVWIADNETVQRANRPSLAAYARFAVSIFPPGSPKP